MPRKQFPEQKPGRLKTKYEKGKTFDALPVRYKLFVMHLAANGGNKAAAARKAGWKVVSDVTGKDHANTKGHYAWRLPQVQAALAEVQAEIDTKLGLGDMVEHIRTRALEIGMSDDPDRVPALNLLAKTTPGALAPAQLQVEAKTFPELVLAAQRAREGAAGALPGISEGEPSGQVEPAGQEQE